MKVKRYVGPTVEEALGRVKEEMGSNAVILNRRKIKPGKGLTGMFKKPLYEIVAAIDDTKRETKPEPRITAQIMSNGYRALEQKVDYIKSAMDVIVSGLPDEARNRGVPDILIPYYTLMRNNDTDPEIIKMVIDGVKSKLNLDFNYDYDYLRYRFKREISSYFNEVRPITLSEGRATVATLVGPTGVGKTTTLAKLAAHYAVALEKRVGIITFDTYRIAAVEQLRTYSEIMNIPIKVIYQAEDIVDTMQDYRDMDLILIDTAGGNHRDKMGLMQLQRMLREIETQQVFLVISATTNYRNVLDIMSSYSFLKDYRILISKVDENISRGIVLNIAVKAGKPLSYITTGQNVPDDIEKVDGEKMATLILSAK